MTSPLPPAAPTHLIRSHTIPLSALSFSEDNERLYSGDTSGLVVVTSTRTLRAIASWKAHSDGLLGVEEWGKHIVTHGRDNKLHVWSRIEDLPASSRVGGSAGLPGLPVPELRYSMDVNALNFCRFSLLRIRPGDDSGETALIALPNLVESSTADVWTLPSRQRLHAAIGQDGKPREFSLENGGRNPTGIIMAVHLYTVSTHNSQPSSSSSNGELRLLCAYENGGVTLRRYARADKQTSVEGIGWETIWSVKLHVESIMAMRVSKGNDLALTVSADHLIGRYDLSTTVAPEAACVVHRTKNPGNGAVAIRDDGKVCAVGGWDGRIRLYTTRTLKPLGTLKYHKTGCQALEFARPLHTVLVLPVGDGGDEDEDDMSEEEKVERARWLVGGGKDNRVSVWTLINFEKS